MKNIMVRDEVYHSLVTIKGKKSFSETIDALFVESVEKKRRNLRKLFGIVTVKERKDIGKYVMEVRRVAKGRLF